MICPNQASFCQLIVASKGMWAWPGKWLQCTWCHSSCVCCMRSKGVSCSTLFPTPGFITLSGVHVKQPYSMMGTWQIFLSYGMMGHERLVKTCKDLSSCTAWWGHERLVIHHDGDRRDLSRLVKPEYGAEADTSAVPYLVESGHHSCHNPEMDVHCAANLFGDGHIQIFEALLFP